MKELWAHPRSCNKPTATPPPSKKALSPLRLFQRRLFNGGSISRIQSVACQELTQADTEKTPLIIIASDFDCNLVSHLESATVLVVYTSESQSVERKEVQVERTRKSSSSGDQSPAAASRSIKL